MSILEILLLGIGLSMDAFAVSICKGLSTKKLQFKHYLIVGAWFGGFQALMPTIGYFLGSTFEQYITAFDHWVAFVLLAAIGANMIKESFSREESETSASFAFKTMLLMALATSIDALAVGITFALLPDVNVPLAVCLIGITTFLCSAAGLRVGNLFGLRYKAKAELAGGIILILIGLIMPAQITFIPLFKMMRSFGLIDSYAGLVLPYLSTAFGVYMMTSFYKMMPFSLVDAARIDGLGEFGIVTRIVMPNAKSGIITLIIFNFQQVWKDLFWPLLLAVVLLGVAAAVFLSCALLECLRQKAFEVLSIERLAGTLADKVKPCGAWLIRKTFRLKEDDEGR